MPLASSMSDSTVTVHSGGVPVPVDGLTEEMDAVQSQVGSVDVFISSLLWSSLVSPLPHTPHTPTHAHAHAHGVSAQQHAHITTITPVSMQ